MAATATASPSASLTPSPAAPPTPAPALDAYGWPIQEENLHLGEMTLILPRLFLGSEKNARDVAALRRNRITHILSVMPHPPALDADGDAGGEDLKYSPTRMTVPVLDIAEEELFSHFRETNAFIDEARNSAGEGAVLVHCQMGVSRSATVVAAYLLATYAPTPTPVAALKLLRAKRRIVEPNWGFREQLALYHRCGCDMDTEGSLVAAEAWRAGMAKKRRVAMDALRREQAKAFVGGGAGSDAGGRERGRGAWLKSWRKASSWAAGVLA